MGLLDRFGHLNAKKLNSITKFDVLGDNIAISGYPTSGTILSVALLDVPRNDNECNVNSRKKIVNMITK